MTNLATLINEWRTAINEEAQTSGKSALLLTAAVSVTPTLNSPSYPVSSINAGMDFVNIMAYDFYSPINTFQTSAHAALNDTSGGISGSSGVTAWINAGLPVNKMVFGLPFYGYAWELSDEANHGLGAPATGVATGDGIDSSGAIIFKEIKSFIESSGAETVYDSEVVVNYCYSGRTWIGYDDVDAVGAKVSYVKENGLRGYFAWSVDGDDNWLLSQKASTTLG
ncbi:Chitinase protein [Dioscorea alata]|uniref:Chitinase protein n=1 Tax=Dioscorea alata TaxID=55571 RepID=A0ACB7VDJ0_DIOAL|nr:Chitinase protein [Dioscorea alata]